MQAAIYCRISREDTAKEPESDESESIRNQRDMLTRYAHEHGYTVYKVYCDENYSGADSERPAFREMLADAKAGQFSIILVKTLSRFTRNLELLEHTVHGCFAEWGIRLIAVLDHIDTAERHSRKSRQLNSLISEWYLEDLSDNIRSVLKHKRQEGQYTGALPPYGYKRDPANKNHLIVDPEAAAVVRTIYRLFLDGYSPSYIARRVESNGISTPSVCKFQKGICKRRPAHNHWRSATILSILHNEVYKGDLVQGKVSPASYKDKTRRKVPVADWIVVRGAHEPIIPPALFDFVQELCRPPDSCHGAPKALPLSGKLICSNCGQKLLLNGKAPYAYYTCGQHLKDKQACSPAASICKDTLESLILGRLQAYLEPLRKGFSKDDSAVPPDSTRQASVNCTAAVIPIKATMYHINEVSAPACSSAEQTSQSGACYIPDCYNSVVQTVFSSPPALSRALVCLTIHRITVHPKCLANKTQEIDIEWRF